MKDTKSKKEIIMDAALDLFSERGYDAVGVDEIGAAAGVKGPAIYHYFKGKEGILNELINGYELNQDFFTQLNHQFGGRVICRHFYIARFCIIFTME